MLSRRKIKYTLWSNQQIAIATHANYYDISLKLYKLGNIMREDILTLKLSIKDGLKIASKTRMKSCWSTINQGLHCA